MSPEQDERLMAAVPAGLKQEIRVEAARQQKPMAQLVREVLRDWAEDELDDYDG
jgi:plasmid stability protein